MGRVKCLDARLDIVYEFVINQHPSAQAQCADITHMQVWDTRMVVALEHFHTSRSRLGLESMLAPCSGGKLVLRMIGT